MQITNLITSAVAKLGFPAWAGAGPAAASLRFLVGIYALDPEAIPVGFRIPEKEFLAQYRRRIPKNNSIATLISHGPLANPETTAQVVAQTGLREALLQPGAYRAAFSELLKPNLNELLELIRLNKVSAGMPRPALQARFREKWRELEASELTGETIEARRLNGRISVGQRYKQEAAARGRPRKSPVFAGAQSKIPKSRRAQTVMDRLLAQGRVKISSRLKRALLSRVDTSDAEECASRVIEPSRLLKKSRGD